MLLLNITDQIAMLTITRLNPIMLITIQLVYNML